MVAHDGRSPGQGLHVPVALQAAGAPPAEGPGGPAPAHHHGSASLTPARSVEGGGISWWCDGCLCEGWRGEGCLCGGWRGGGLKGVCGEVGGMGVCVGVGRVGG